MGIGKFLARSAFNKDPGGRMLTNAFTGYKPSRTASWAAGITAVGIGAGVGMAQYKAYEDWGVGSAYRARTMGSVDYSGNIPDLVYEGRANINKMTGQYDLGADGDIVLAMSANRRAR